MKGAKFLSDLWLKWYSTDHCTLCGNSGIIDTRHTAVTAAGWHVGRLNWCLCPNGVAIREGRQNSGPPTEEDLRRRR